MTGTIIAVVGPSGAGKDTLMRNAVARRPEIALMRRVITRPADADSEDFEGVTQAAFNQMRAEGRFALTWQAHGLNYGIPYPSTISAVTLVNLSRAALDRAADAFPGLRVIHVDAAAEIRASRLAARGRETAEEITRRITREAKFASGDLPVTHINNSGDLETATTAFLAALDEVLVP
ncbi:phosphonate metabolism protein/1,5-bisphosphokinase (PRPP-forming) PhnN [Paracoccus sp. MBLB3053]|uniref:Ribose 1,5-bisphosphate phosphokinase PhnN n=1 Tax=Paracoccus aurantius TaxID=3073814 RepID=A0ABU2HV88_9RHOB|nr:phosphonate metabolism protein/1,5-bisphosphokinase (PRPP-forming) PhnN [Paracoccus sp. MBLB3053]MDS9468951.1 phosphonate metabolism protein/1,5-bisphosphokinase (PRPP-forming) PhnN [Paracoccus sp. MBLB3053]